MTCQPWRVILCCLPAKGRKQKEEIVEAMKDRDREERRKWKWKKTEEITTSLLYLYLLQGQQALPNCKPISVGCPSDKSYRTPFTSTNNPPCPHPPPPPPAPPPHPNPTHCWARKPPRWSICYCSYVIQHWNWEQGLKFYQLEMQPPPLNPNPPWFCCCLS